ncbi:MAG: hypothetical protein JXA07_13095 [Spirochaetes bacterium]|nr:hypothetical protein [Spirochaetota bacterium]
MHRPARYSAHRFMARMLFYFPDKRREAIRYYGIKQKLGQITRKTWAHAIEHSCETNPEICPYCGAHMIESVVFAYFAEREWRKLWKTHLLHACYFRMKKGP